MLQLVDYDCSSDSDSSEVTSKQSKCTKADVIEELSFDPAVLLVVRQLVDSVSTSSNLGNLSICGHHSAALSYVEHSQQFRQKQPLYDEESDNCEWRRSSDSEEEEESEDELLFDGDQVEKCGIVVVYAPVTAGSSEEEDEDDEFSRIVALTRQHRQRQQQYNAPSHLSSAVGKGKVVNFKGDIDVLNLPPIDKLSLNVPIDEQIKLKPLGKVTSCVAGLVIIQSNFGNAALDGDSVLFAEGKDGEKLENRLIGLVFDTFGLVSRPLYSVQIPVDCPILDRLQTGSTVYFAPDSAQLTKTVFTNALRKMRYTDASWRHDAEAPLEEQEFSDDEAERQFRAKHRRKRQADDGGGDDNEQIGPTNTDHRGRGRPWRRAAPRSRAGRGRAGRTSAPQTFRPTTPFMAQNRTPFWRSSCPQRFGRRGAEFIPFGPTVPLGRAAHRMVPPRFPTAAMSDLMELEDPWAALVDTRFCPK